MDTQSDINTQKPNTSMLTFVNNYQHAVVTQDEFEMRAGAKFKAKNEERLAQLVGHNDDDEYRVEEIPFNPIASGQISICIDVIQNNLGGILRRIFCIIAVLTATLTVLGLDLIYDGKPNYDAIKDSCPAYWSSFDLEQAWVSQLMMSCGNFVILIVAILKKIFGWDEACMRRLERKNYLIIPVVIIIMGAFMSVGMGIGSVLQYG